MDDADEDEEPPHEENHCLDTWLSSFGHDGDEKEYTPSAMRRSTPRHGDEEEYTPSEQH